MTRKWRFAQKIIAGCLAVAIGCSLIGCNKSDKSKKEKTNQGTQKFINTLSKPDQEAVALLSQKYDLQPSLVEKFLDLYLTETDIQFRMFKESVKAPENKSKTYDIEQIFLEKEGYLTALVNSSKTAGITTKTAALLVTDYKTITTKERSSE